MHPKKEKTPIHKKISENEALLKDRLGIGKSFDIGVRKLKILNKEVQVYYCTGLCDSGFIIQLLRELMDMDYEYGSSSNTKDVIKNHLAHQQVSTVKSLDEVMDRVLSGLIGVLIDGTNEGFIVDVRSYPGRSPKEPDVEKVVRGSRDGYTENIVENTALTRRRVRDERLRHEIIQIGDRSKTDVCIAYLQDVADPSLVETIRKELTEIRIDGIPMADKTVEEFLVKQGWNPFPLVRYTERPDVAAVHILEGHVLIYVDTSPSIIITPTTFFHHVQHAEEYRQTPMIGAFLRWIRFGGMLTSVLLIPLWLLFVLNENLLPENLDFIGPAKDSNIPIFVQIIFAELGIDVLRMAAIHTPSALSTAMGLIAAVLIGQIAIDVGLFVSEVILYVALAAIGSFSTPSYELSVANKMVRLFLITAVVLFDVPGFVIGLTLVILFLSRIQNLNTPYLWPFIPFNPQALFQVLIRVSVPLSKVRPSIVRPKDNKKQTNAG
ncbi:spore germination protein [Alkalihalobacillus sp. AL-G]|uniref:spore germination protein n=1 Tax=Alkalihalobacillus sp. AL-G TaxID=2926399 RepID=UPI00272AF6A8|nr:spore germination protein [Alkalihalobacillus sp. AL-G]WLD91889.1 spore germination protein [Alkalihalobacillus sp. AL-G]